MLQRLMSSILYTSSNKWLSIVWWYSFSCVHAW